MPVSQTDATTIPALPCASLGETLPFYQVLGFEVTYQQKSPNPYAVVRRGGIELHFFVNRLCPGFIRVIRGKSATGSLP